MVTPEGAVAGADVSQWQLGWTNVLCRVRNGVATKEEYYQGTALWG